MNTNAMTAVHQKTIIAQLTTGILFLNVNTALR